MKIYIYGKPRTGTNFLVHLFYAYGKNFISEPRNKWFRNTYLDNTVLELFYKYNYDVIKELDWQVSPVELNIIKENDDIFVISTYRKNILKRISSYQQALKQNKWTGRTYDIEKINIDLEKLENEIKNDNGHYNYLKSFSNEILYYEDLEKDENIVINYLNKLLDKNITSNDLDKFRKFGLIKQENIPLKERINNLDDTIKLLEKYNLMWMLD